MCSLSSRGTPGTPALVPGDVLPIYRAAHDSLLALLGGHPPEAGGILAQDLCGRIQIFAFDENAGCGKGAYRPTSEWVISVCESWWMAGLLFAGFAHSHPDGYHLLSPKDIACAMQFLQMNPAIPKLVMAIVSSARLSLYIVFPDGCVYPAKAHIV